MQCDFGMKKLFIKHSVRNGILVIEDVSQLNRNINQGFKYTLNLLSDLNSHILSDLEWGNYSDTSATGSVQRLKEASVSTSNERHPWQFSIVRSIFLRIRSCHRLQNSSLREEWSSELILNRKLVNFFDDGFLGSSTSRILTGKWSFPFLRHNFCRRTSKSKVELIFHQG